MKIDCEYIIDFCYIIFIGLSIYLYYNGIYKTRLDNIFGTLAIVIGVLVVFFRNKLDLIFAHVFYSIYLILVSIFSNNNYLLGFNVIMLINIIVTRYLYDGCLLKQMRNKNSVDTVNHNINGDYYYSTLLFISIYRLMTMEML